MYIAIIEDDESLGRSMSRLLQASGYQTITYPSGESFLDDMKKPKFDCMIVDVQLGGMSGIELGDRLKDNGTAIPLVYITAHEDWEALGNSISASGNGFVRKIDVAEILLAEIDKVMNGAPRTLENAKL